MTNPRFSIITITYNNLDGLKKTATSITQQRLHDYEWIIIDGGSNDGTLEYLKTLKATYISEVDDGIYDAMNKGLDRVSGDYVIYMNAGDQFAGASVLNDLSHDIKQLNAPDFIYGPALEEGLGTTPTQKSALPVAYLPWGMITHHQAMLYKASTIETIRYNQKYKIAADYDFTCRALKNAKSVHMTQYDLCLFEAGGISQTEVKTGRSEQFAIRKQLKVCSPLLNHTIYRMQTLTMLLRKKAPSLYWFIRRFFRP